MPQSTRAHSRPKWILPRTWVPPVLSRAISNYGYLGNGNAVSVLRNTGASGSIAFAPKVDFPVGTGPHGIGAGDLDSDGKLDLVTANYGYGGGGATASILRNTSTVGNLSFATALDLTAVAGPLNVVVGDIDGDGKSDLVFTNFQNGVGTSVSIFLNTSAVGVIAFAPKVDVTVGVGPYGIAFGDIDGDGKLDLAVANFGGQATGDGNTVSVLRNTSAIGNVTFAPKVNFTTGAGPRGVSPRDFDGDGKSDLAITNFAAGGGGTTISVLRNTSPSANVSFASKIDLTANTGVLSVESGDLDGDGKPDLAVTNYGANYPLPVNLGTTVSVFGNTSTVGNISFAPKVDFGVAPGPHCVAIGDVDQNNKPDLAIVSFGNGDVAIASVLQNTTGTVFNTPTFTPTSAFTATNTPTLAPSPTSSGIFSIGETNVLATDDSGNGNLLIGQQVALSQSATIQSLGFYVAVVSGRLRLGIYDDASGNPGTLKAQTAEFTPVTGWNTQNVVTPMQLSAGTYWLAYLPESSSLHFRLATSGVARWASYSYGALPTTFSTSPQSGSYHWSFYATLR